MTKKKEKWPKKKMGQECGYTEFEDGSIEIALYYRTTIDNLNNQETSLKTLLDHFTEQAHNLMTSILKGKQDFWEKIGKDYGFDFTKYTYTYRNGRISKKIFNRKISPSR